MNQRELYDSTSNLLSSDKQKKILLIPGSIGIAEQKKDGSSFAHLAITMFPHPGTETTVLWAFDTKAGEAFHLVEMEEECSSWFLGNFVIEGGSFYTLVPIDPLFLVIPILCKTKEKKSFQLLDQILAQCDQSHYQIASRILCEFSSIFLKDLDLICRCKVVNGAKYWKLCNRMLVNWVKAKMSCLSSQLELENVNVTSKVCVSGFSRSKKDTAPSKDMYERFALGMICDFLPLIIREKLTKNLGLEEIKLDANADDSSKKRKTETVDDVVEDYSKSFKPTPKPVEKKLTAAQKRLQKVDKTGMKSISSYFTSTKTAEK